VNSRIVEDGHTLIYSAQLYSGVANATDGLMSRH